MDIKVPFLKKPVGMGDAVKAVTEAAGVTPCGGCQKRREALNRRVRLVPASSADAALPSGQVGQPYEAKLDGRVIAGEIPPGLEVDPQTRTLRGAPTEAGVFTLTIEGPKTFSIEVKE